MSGPVTFKRLRSLARRLLPAMLATAAVPGAALAQSFPSKPVTIVVPYTPGGATDTVARLVAKGLGARLGQSVIVENKPGAAGNIGTDYVGRAAPDGYTVLFATTANAINEGLYDKLNYHIATDFVPITQLVQLQNVVVTKAGFAADSMGELLKMAREKPGGLAYASAGLGSSTHLAAELFNYQAKVKMLHVPYKGSAPAITAILGGDVQLMFDNLPSSLSHIRGGTLQALAVTGKQRSALLPDVPTVSEAGVPGYEIVAWHGLSAPKGTPPAIVQELARNTVAVLKDPEVAGALQRMGAEVVAEGPEAFGARIEQDIAKFKTVVRSSGMQNQ